MNKWIAVLACCTFSPLVTGAEMPIIDVHIHYSEDAWDNLPPKEAIATLRKAGLKRAIVSSSGDDGTLKLHAEAPDLIIPSLRPYRSRSENSTWVRDASVIPYLEERLKKHRYVAIGEFHVFGGDADLPVMHRVVQLAAQYKLYLHAHSDANAVERIFAQDPKARVLWAHSGFMPPHQVRDILRRYPNLWADLAFRSDQAVDNKVVAEWRAVFEEFPDRFMLGTDTYTPERWHFVAEHASWSRGWLKDLPRELAERIAFRNIEALLGAGDLACAPELRGVPLNSERNVLVYRADPGDIQVGRPFSMDIAVCAKNEASVDKISVDAHMPEHRHGMNYRPSVTQVGAGRFRIEGMLFHMPGQWEFLFDVPSKAGTERIKSTLVLK